MNRIAVLSHYFNPDGPAKRPFMEFAKELKALSEEDKVELSSLAAAAMGETITG